MQPSWVMTSTQSAVLCHCNSFIEWSQTVYNTYNKHCDYNHNFWSLRNWSKKIFPIYFRLGGSTKVNFWELLEQDFLQARCPSPFLSPNQHHQNIEANTTVPITHIRNTTNTCLKAYITIAIRLRYDYDTTTTKNWHVNFLLESNRVEWKQARAIRRSRIVVISQSNRNFDHFRRSRMCRGIVVS